MKIDVDLQEFYTGLKNIVKVKDELANNNEDIILANGIAYRIGQRESAVCPFPYDGEPIAVDKKLFISFLEQFSKDTIEMIVDKNIITLSKGKTTMSTTLSPFKLDEELKFLQDASALPVTALKTPERLKDIVDTLMLVTPDTEVQTDMFNYLYFYKDKMITVTNEKLGVFKSDINFTDTMLRAKSIGIFGADFDGVKMSEEVIALPYPDKKFTLLLSKAEIDKNDMELTIMELLKEIDSEVKEAGECTLELTKEFIKELKVLKKINNTSKVPVVKLTKDQAEIELDLDKTTYKAVVPAGYNGKDKTIIMYPDTILNMLEKSNVFLVTENYLVLDSVTGWLVVSTEADND